MVANRLLVATAILFGLAVHSIASPRQEAFHWLEQMGYVPLFAKPIVKVRTLKDGRIDSEGLLVREDPKQVEIVDLGLRHFVYENRKQVQVTPISADTLFRDQQIYLESKQSVAEAVCAAYLAEKVGNDKLSSHFFELQPTSGYSLAALKDDVGFVEFANIARSIFENEEPWPSIRSRIAQFLDRFPNHGLSDRARDYLATLDRMALEQRERGGKPYPNRIDELIYQLRNHVGHVEWAPGAGEPVYPIAHLREPGELLCAMGDKAVPALIRAVTDETLTHSSAQQELAMAHYWVQPVQRVGDIAVSILELISSQRFMQGGYSDSRDYWRSEQRKAQERALAWWSKKRR